MRCDRAGCLTEASTGSITEKEKKAPIAVGLGRWAVGGAAMAQHTAPEARTQATPTLSARDPGDQVPKSLISTNPLQVRIVFEQGFVFISQSN